MNPTEKSMTKAKILVNGVIDSIPKSDGESLIHEIAKALDYEFTRGYSAGEGTGVRTIPRHRYPYE